MSNKASIYYDIISEFKGKGAKDAEASFLKLGSTASSLGAKIMGAFSVTALSAFAGKAISLAAAEEKQFAILGNTLKNLGLGFAAESSTKMIDAMFLATGVAKSELIPAYQQLLVATSDVALSQKDLQIALDVSKGTGKDITAVTAAMSKAYLGNTTALKRLGAGIDSTLIKTGNMKLIMEQLAKTFRGSAATAAETFSGQVKILHAATEQATVTIGQGLIKSLQTLAGDQSLKTITGQIQNFADNTSLAIQGVADLIKQLERIPGVTKAFSNISKNPLNIIPVLGPYLQALANRKKASLEGLSMSASIDPMQVVYDKQAQAKALKAKADQLAAEKKILATQKQQTAEQKAQATLKLAGNSDDLQKAELLAALKRNITQADKDQVNYQLDLLNAVGKTGDALQKAADDALILREKILMANGLVMLADGSIANLHEAKNPFAGFDKYVQDALAQLAKVQSAIDSTKPIMANSTVTPSMIANGTGYVSSQGLTSSDLTSGTFAQYYQGQSGGLYGSTPVNPPVTVNLSVTTDPGVIVEHTNAASANGTAVTLNRNNPGFG
jgi:hypothetical protein